MAAFTLTPTARSGPKTAKTSKVIVITLDDDITLGLATHVASSLLSNENVGAAILRIDTFGGRVDAALDIAAMIEGVDFPVHAWVLDKAWSAGALVALACTSIHMRKSASIGSATPVLAGGGRTRPAGEKHVSALRAKFRGLAERNGYPPELAAAMVDKDVAVVRVRINGEDRFVSLDEGKTLVKKNPKKAKLETVVTKGKLLNLNTQRAVEYGIAKEAETLSDILESLGLTGAEILQIEKTQIERFVNLVTSTAGASILVFLGFMLISAEMHAAGFGWFGIGGIICFSLIFWGHNLTNMAGPLSLGLVLGGLILLTLEIFVVPGFGLTGVSGFACLLLGIYLMLVPYVIPKTPWDYTRLREIFWIMASAGAGTVVGFVSLILMVPKMPIFKRYQPVKTAGAAPPDTPPAGELGPGTKGLSLARIAPTGRAQFRTHFIEVKSESGEIAPGLAIEIVKAGDIPVVRLSR